MKQRVSRYILLGIFLASMLGVISGTLMWPKGMGVLHMLMSRRMLAAGKIDAAIEQAREAVELMPDSYVATHNLVEIYADTDMYEEAEKAVEELIKHSPETAGAYLDLGGLKLIRRDVEGAREAAEKAVSISPDYGECYYLLGALAREDGDIETAEEYFVKAIELSPHSYKSYHSLGVIYSKRKDYDAAIEKLEKATELNPNLSDAHATMGLIYFEQKLYNHSLGQLSTAVDLDPSDSASMYNIACVYSLQNNPAAAVKWLGRAFDNDFKNFDLIGKDPDLDNIRDDPRFIELVAAAAEDVASED
jgi:tetratricopeptide (TPR) repeat protein